MDNGYLKCDARITKTGVFNYRLADGAIRRELRIPKEVFKADSLSTFMDVPLTNGHPPSRLTSKNTKQFQVGLINDVRQDEAFVAAKVLVTDEDVIGAAESGKREMSCGYYCDLDMQPGVTKNITGVPDGLKFDAVQRNIRGNHVALVEKGRAGGGAALHLDSDDWSALHLDADDAIMVQDGHGPTDRSHFNFDGGRGNDPGQRRNRMNYRLDGVDFDVDQQLAQALDKKFDKLDKDVAGIKEGISKEKARADTAEEKLKAAQEEKSDEKIAKAVKVRVALQSKAAEILKTDDGKDPIKLDDMTATSICKAVIEKVHPGSKEKLDGADAAYVAARYDMAIEAFDEKVKTDADNATRSANNGVGGDGSGNPAGGGGEHHDSETARAKMIADTVNRGRTAVPGQPGSQQ